MASADHHLLEARAAGETHGREGATSRDAPAAHRFAISVTALVAIGFVLRLTYVLAFRRRLVASDAFFYITNANGLAKGHGFVDVLNGAPTAYHPPAWPAVLSAASFLGFTGPLGHQVLACVVGAITLVLVALAGRQIAGERAGILAAAIAALYPNVWIWEREVAAETLILSLVACAVLLAYRFLDRPRIVTLVGLGVVCGLLTLTRAEQVVLFFLLAVPLVLRARLPWRCAAAWTGAGALAMVLVLTPWLEFNSSRFEKQVFIATDFGPTVRLSNDAATYSGSRLGSLDVALWRHPVPGADESVIDAVTRHEAVAYARAHLNRLPVVLAARQGRTWGMFQVLQQARFDGAWGNDPIWALWAGVATYWLLLPAAVVGGVALRRRGRPVFPLVTPFVVVVFATTVTYGEPRLRASAEVPLVLLAAVAIDAGVRRIRTRRSVDRRFADGDQPSGRNTV